MFYVVNFENFNVIFDMLMLINKFIIVNLIKVIWRFKINVKNLTIEKLKNFAKNFNDKKIVFALICVDVNKITIINNFVILTVFKQVKKYLKQFNNKKIKLLFEQKSSYYTINLMKN